MPKSRAPATASAASLWLRRSRVPTVVFRASTNVAPYATDQSPVVLSVDHDDTPLPMARSLDGKAIAAYGGRCSKRSECALAAVSEGAHTRRTPHHSGLGPRRREIRHGLAVDIAAFKQQYAIVPGLAILQVGDREDSSVYVRMKEKAALEVRIDAARRRDRAPPPTSHARGRWRGLRTPLVRARRLV